MINKCTLIAVKKKPIKKRKIVRLSCYKSALYLSHFSRFHDYVIIKR